ncbi:MAG: efflux RND transporter periplasmic adaptor subunit [Gemmataceae bacterium]|nr:efflux RND transporter periplasmic adaptor subunit [Gemmataceae bacterium]MDW8264766.1 efflux RND transporter periplasmic adaptor subunit [Gemmataceae bacterium]
MSTTATSSGWGQRPLVWLLAGLGLGFTIGSIVTVWLGAFGTAEPLGLGKLRTYNRPNREVRPTPLPGVVALGRLEPAGGVIAVSAPGPDIIKEVLISEGQTVEKGEPLAILESHTERQLERDHAKGEYQEALRRRERIRAEAEQRIAEARLARDQVASLGPCDIEAQQIKVSLLEYQLQEARKDLNRLAELRATRDITVPQQQYDQQRLLVEQTEKELEAARSALHKLKRALGYNLRTADAQVRSAELARDRALEEIPVAALKRAWELAEKRLERAVVRAPQAGTILRLFVRPGEAVGTAPILQLADTRQMVVIAEVYETDIERVRVGQRAVVVVPALRQVAGDLNADPVELEGTVDRIGAVVARNQLVDLDPTADADKRVVEVRVALGQAGSARVARLIYHQVSVRILVEQPAAPATAARAVPAP